LKSLFINFTKKYFKKGCKSRTMFKCLFKRKRIYLSFS